MTSIGKEFRLSRIFREDKKTLIVAMDHGFFGGPVPGLENPADKIRQVILGGADAIMTTFGIIRNFHKELARRVGVIWSIPSDPAYVKIATKLGVDAVKTTHFVNIHELKSLEIIGRIAAECENLGMPLLTEIVLIQKTGENQVALLFESKDVKIASRCGAEQGADFVKTVYTGSVESFREVVSYCPVPIVILGGAKMETDEQVLTMVKSSIEAGGAGVAFGRNIWQHKNPAAITKAILRIIHEGSEVSEVLSDLKNL